MNRGLFKKSHYYFFVSCLLLAIIFLFGVNYKSMRCGIVAEKKTVQGSSLRPRLDDGDTVKLLKNFYRCNPIERDDVLAFSAPGDNNPVIKIVRGLPGDQFGILTNNGFSQLVVNGVVLKTDSGAVYQLSEQRAAFWKMYIKNFNGILPNQTMILLGNIPTGSLDSILLGPIHLKQVIGKIVQ